jgi:enoyl-[acyl-carrier protein] reductase I
MGLLEGKNALVIGVANKRSIAWAVAQAMSREGARLALTYQNERVEKMVRDCAEQIPGTPMIQMDAADDAQIEAAYRQLGEQFDKLDILVYSIAFANADEMNGRFVDTSRDGFKQALEISAYSLIAVTRKALPLMTQGGSVMTMTYIASERVFPSYNVMGVAKATLEAIVRYLAADLGPQGVRVNALSPGPVTTLAAAGVPGFKGFAKSHAERAPLRRGTDKAEVGDTAVFLASDLSRGITGETVFIDGGYHVLGI